MRAMVLDVAGSPLREDDRRSRPEPGPGEVAIQVRACGVCRTDLHIIDGELSKPKPSLIPGHEIVGTVVAAGERVDQFRKGDRVGVPWLGGTCGVCPFCRSGRENLCDRAKFTGYDRDGGYAEFTVADSRFVFPLPPGYTDEEAAPLLCAGLIGYRALRLAGDASRIGFYGFGASAHIAVQVARVPGTEGVCLHPAGGHARAGVRPQPRGGLGGRLGSGSPRIPGCVGHLRAGGFVQY